MTTRPVPVLTLIAAVSVDGYISTGKGVPWDLPADREHFRRTTRGQWLLIGRRTYEEMLGWFEDHHPLVLTHDAAFTPPVGRKVNSVAEALAIAANSGAGELFVCGGGGAYAAAIQHADRLILTHVAVKLGSGVRFPVIDSRQWQAVSETTAPADSGNPHAMTIVRYERRRPSDASD